MSICSHIRAQEALDSVNQVEEIAISLRQYETSQLLCRLTVRPGSYEQYQLLPCLP